MKELDGKILLQDIPAETPVPIGTAIKVSYHKYDPKEVQRIPVPYFVGKTVKEAKAIAEEKGLKIEVYDGEDDAIIVSQDKEAGSQIYLNDIVKLTVKGD